LSKTQKRENLLQLSEVERGRSEKKICHTDPSPTRPPKKKSSTSKKKKKGLPANAFPAPHHGPVCFQ